MRQLLISILLLCTGLAETRANNDSLLTELSKAIHQSAAYDSAILREIEVLKEPLRFPGMPPPLVFQRLQSVFEAYKLSQYDSAYSYAIRMAAVAKQIHDPLYAATARLKIGFMLLSAGLYKETYDTLHSLAGGPIPDTLKGEYYTLWGRYYYDLAAYANDHYHSVDYDTLANSYLDSALTFFPHESFEYIYYSGLLNYKQRHPQKAAAFFEQLLADRSLSYHQLALTTSTFSAIYLERGDRDQAINLLIRATIADILSGTKETVAIFHLADLLYKTGDLKQAVMCIESAIANAQFYGARQRKIQASSILPLIEGERINGIEAQKSLLIKYAILVTVLVLALMVLAWIILRQIKKLKLTQEALTHANNNQQVINHQLEESNRRLEEANEKLGEANKIQEEYIGYFFNMDSEFYSKLGKIKSTIELKLQERRYDDIKFFLNKIDARKEKEELLLSFDKIFLKLFPNFAAEVNTLLREDEKIRLKEGELLSTDLRIFALIRMGVADPEKIAQILEYSVKTIYSYKSRLRSKSDLPGDEFEQKVMQIKSL